MENANPKEYKPETMLVQWSLSQNIELEQALLGAVLSNNHAINQIGHELEEKHFHLALHRRIYAKVRAASDEGRPINAVTLQHEFSDTEERPESRYIARLVSSATTVANLREYATILLNLAAVRMLQQAALQIIQSPPETQANELVELIADAVTYAENDASVQAQSSALITDQILDDINNGMAPTKTGMERLDNMLCGGLYPGKMYGIGARKKTGKTTLLGTISHNLNYSTEPLQQGQSGKHLFICGEMGAKEIHQRSLARTLGVEPSVFLLGQNRPSNFKERLQHEATHGQRRALYMDAPNLTLQSLKRMVAIAVAKHKIDGFMLDYWQLVGGGKSNGKTEHLDEVAQWIAGACKKYGIWAMVSAQINREGNYRGGDGLQNASDMVLTLEKQDPTRVLAWLAVADSRFTKYGSLGDKEKPGLYMNPKGPFFEEATDEHRDADRQAYFSAIPDNESGGF